MKREQYEVVDGGDSQQPREYGFTDVGASDRGYWLVVIDQAGTTLLVLRTSAFLYSYLCVALLFQMYTRAPLYRFTFVQTTTDVAPSDFVY